MIRSRDPFILWGPKVISKTDEARVVIFFSTGRLYTVDKPPLKGSWSGRVVAAIISLERLKLESQNYIYIYRYNIPSVSLWMTNYSLMGMVIGQG